MSNSQGLCVSFERDWFDGIHDFATDSIRAALYLTTASVDYTTTAYTTTGEASGINYSPGGVLVDTSQSPQSLVQTTYWNPGSDISYPVMTLSGLVNAVLLYNSSKSNKSIGVWTFAPTQVVNRAFVLHLPAMSSSLALLRFVQS